MVTALLFGVVASSTLVLGAVIGSTRTVSDGLVGATLAFASGALFTAVAYDLFEPAIRETGALLAGGGLVAGSVVFTTIAWLLDEHVGGDEARGLSLLASVTLYGVPENLALGVALVGAGEGSPLALLAGIFASNFPESLDSAQFFVRQGHSARYAVGLWIVAAASLTLAVVAGAALFRGLDQLTTSVLQAFAGGSVLAAIADDALPNAYEEGGPVIALATTAGFFLTFLLQ